VIGLFDSGIGGLTVLKSLQRYLPNEPFIYLGDTARLPYGTKSSETISRYTQQNISFLNEKGVDLIISACHSASSAILQYNIKGPVTLLNVIEPACSEAMRESKNKKIALMATQATVDAGQYQRLLQAPFELFSAACPLLVPLVESGWTNDIITDQIIERYTRPLLDHGVDTIILGCTHFPLLKESIQKIVGPHIKLVDPGDCLAQQILNMNRTTGVGQKLHVYLTDESPHFVKTAQSILPGQDLQLSQVDL
jgi:glutamate racemase